MNASNMNASNGRRVTDQLRLEIQQQIDAGHTTLSAQLSNSLGSSSKLGARC